MFNLKQLLREAHKIVGLWGEIHYVTSDEPDKTKTCDLGASEIEPFILLLQLINAIKVFDPPKRLNIT